MKLRSGVTSFICFLAAFLLLIEHHSTFSYMLENDPTRRAEYLDSEGKFLLEWEPLWSTGRIVFNVTVETTGYVALGFSNGGNAAAAGVVDMLIAGVFEYDKAYFWDYHIGREGHPKIDRSQDYILHGAWESDTHTFICFTRLMDTCDSNDYPITDSKVTLIWAYGEEDNHDKSWDWGKRGNYEVYLLDQDYSPKIERDHRNGGKPRVDSEELDIWTIARRKRIPSNETSYFCSMHRGPKLRRKHHVVGFDVQFPDEESQKCIQHLFIYKCNAPEGISHGIFEPFVGDHDQACYNIFRLPTNGPMPIHFCTELYLGWAVGGRSFFTPPHVGLPVASTPNEYYMVQVHYDNPEQRSNLVVEVRMDFFYTGYLRSFEGGLMGLGHDVPGLTPSILIPPNAANHRVFGHCSPECTKRMYSSIGGITIFAGILHSHTTGRHILLHHFSSKTPHQEQPWILYDNNYSSRFQQIRHLHLERKILPGDQLTVECSYDNTWSNSSTVTGGFATRQEVCLAFIMYYNRVSDYHICRSEIVSDEYRLHFLGVNNVTWIESQLDWVATDRSSGIRLTGLTSQQLSDNYVEWDSGSRQELQRFHEVHPHVGKCSRDLYARSAAALQALMQSAGANVPSATERVAMNIDTEDDFSGPVGYPHGIRLYNPPNICSDRRERHRNKDLHHFL